uniref:Uncharacterized protein n=1 Tax=Anguilla anguilla TaxID=7936 RepID=A0A0E9P9S4_ANGAN
MFNSELPSVYRQFYTSMLTSTPIVIFIPK